MVERLQEDHVNAKLLSQELAKIDEIEMNIKNVHTNLIFFNLKSNNITCDDLITELLNYEIKIDYKGNHKFRMVTHYGFEKNDITKVILAFKEIFNNKGN